MKRNIRKITVKLTSALLLAATLMGTAATAVRADEMNVKPTECVETVVEGQGDVIDDEFAYVEGQGDVIDDQFAVVEGQGDVIDDQFAVVEGQGDVIDDQFAVVEGQGDIIDDCFAVTPEETQPATETVTETPVVEEQPVAEVEGQGDVIDDEFAYVEGQGDVIDDQFAVTPEAETAVEAVEVANNNAEVTATSVNSLAAVGSADLVEGHIFEPTDIDEDIKKAYEDMYLKEDEKGWFTKKMEFVNKLVDPSNFVSDEISKTIDESKSVGVAEKVLGKELVRNGLSTAFGAPVPEAGTPKKMLKAIESFSRGVDAPTTAGKVLNALDGVKNCVEAGVCLMPGGGLVVAGVEASVSVVKYGATKLLSWLW